MVLLVGVLARGRRNRKHCRAGPTGSWPSTSAQVPTRSSRRWGARPCSTKAAPAQRRAGDAPCQLAPLSRPGSQPDDPGWHPTLAAMWWLLVPGWGIRRQRHQLAAGANGLTALRQLFVNFAAALLLIGVVVVVVLSATSPKLTQHPLPVLAVAAAIVAAGAVALGVPRLIDRPLDCSDDGRLAASYRTRFFMRVAFSQAASLIGFVGFILSNAGWLYALGAAFTAVGYYRLAPTAAHLASDQDGLRQAGCQRSLIQALAGPPTTEP